MLLAIYPKLSFQGAEYLPSVEGVATTLVQTVRG